jgi:hypothetical protein
MIIYSLINYRDPAAQPAAGLYTVRRHQLYERASDPWVRFGPNGDAHQISLSFNNTANLDNAILVSKSPAGSAGRQWSAPITLKRDTNPAVFNDKESITADQNNANYVYAVLDRLVFPNEARTASRT